MNYAENIISNRYVGHNYIEFRYVVFLVLKTIEIDDNNRLKTRYKKYNNNYGNYDYYNSYYYDYKR